MKIQGILLSTDGSEFSKGAIREAIRLAKRYSCKLYVISVIETNPEFEALAPEIVEKAEIQTRDHLISVKELAKAEGVDCETIVNRGEEPYRFIVDEVSKRKIDLIVMGRRGKKGLTRLLMGSVTARTIGHATCDVLVVPRAAHIELKKILVATDGSKYSDAAATKAVRIAKSCGSLLVAVSVVPSESISPFDIVHSEMQKDLIIEKELKVAEGAIQGIKEMCKKEGVPFEGLIFTGKPYEAIVSAAKEKKADLIVVGSHGRTGITRLLMGSVAERVIGLSECAVLVVKT